MADSVKAYPAEWTVVVSAASATATATKAAEAGVTHYITTVLAGYSGNSDEGLMQVKDGTTVIAHAYVHTNSNEEINFNTPLAGTEGNLVEATIPSQTGTGYISMMGYSVGD